IDLLAGWTLAGLLTMFLLIRVFHVHAHEHGDTSDVGKKHDHSPEEPCEHHHEHRDQAAGNHPFSWLGLAFGLSLHTLIDGLALAAGVFLCISLADLLPEVAFHAHDRVRLTLALFLGVALAWGIGFLGPEHAHGAHEKRSASQLLHR